MPKSRNKNWPVRFFKLVDIPAYVNLNAWVLELWLSRVHKYSSEPFFSLYSPLFIRKVRHKPEFYPIKAWCEQKNACVIFKTHEFPLNSENSYPRPILRVGRKKRTTTSGSLLKIPKIHPVHILERQISKINSIDKSETWNLIQWFQLTSTLPFRTKCSCEVPRHFMMW